MTSFFTDYDVGDEKIHNERVRDMYGYPKEVRGFNAQCVNCSSVNVTICYAIRYERNPYASQQVLAHTWIKIKCRNCKQELKLFEHM